VEVEGQRMDLSKEDALYVERKRMFLTYCTETFCDEEGERTFIFLEGNGLLF
jgi:hypothetical protein